MSEHNVDAVTRADRDTVVSGLLKVIRDTPRLANLPQEDLMTIYLAGVFAGLEVAKAVTDGLVVTQPR